VDFALTPEQSMLREVVRKYCADHCGFEARRAAGNSDAANRSHWQRFAELGWLGLGLPEEVGGTGGSACDHTIIFEEFGRAIVVEPLLSCIALAARVINAAGRPEQRKNLLAPVVRGELRIALAHHQSDAGAPILARRGPMDTYILRGRKDVVLDGADAAILLVPAQLSGAPSGADGLSIFIVDPTSDGVSRRKYFTLDGLQACDVVLEDVRVNGDAVLGDSVLDDPVLSNPVLSDPVLSNLRSGSQAIRSGLEYAMIAACAEMVGGMEGLLWLTRDYLRQRRQYGVALSSLQVLQHRMAEMFAELELSRSMLYQGLCALEHTDAETRHRLVRAVKTYVSKSARFIGETALQLHGAMGMAEEYKASHYFRRLVTLAALFAPADEDCPRSAQPDPLPARPTT
jgi:alkylation response protein AidB-like acyl-CoA dehydrogenase